jgi:hypothetical protein
VILPTIRSYLFLPTHCLAKGAARTPLLRDAVFTDCLATVVARARLLRDVTASRGRVFTERCVMIGYVTSLVEMQSSRDPYLLRHPRHNIYIYIYIARWYSYKAAHLVLHSAFSLTIEINKFQHLHIPPDWDEGYNLKHQMRP